ncbi:MAG TPA: hypothetical protein VK961_05135 [Chthoniobacter sp.]|nr:hypothetical protein [Chthoniobacter sp.]
MSLAEIESAVESLPADQQELLLRHLTVKLYGDNKASASLVVENGRPVLVAPAGAPVMTPAFVKATLADFP